MTITSNAGTFSIFANGIPIAAPWFPLMENEKIKERIFNS
tara:strand:+ start:7322 stop:7441 length:120 start_codon:yes stop_codon:yes gene_type:complete